VCDLAVPADVDPRVVRMRPNARVLRGGLLQLPDNQDLGLPALDLPHGNVYACLGEALLLGLSGMRSSYSCGPLSPQRVRFMSSLAAHHGFLANAKWLQEGVETDA
jgi:predicted amino acid dehydrogenase